MILPLTKKANSKLPKEKITDKNEKPPKPKRTERISAKK
jgi:hypothetical protein